MLHLLHDDHHGRSTLGDVAPLVITDWWCTECGRGEADETTRLCPECTYMAADGHVRLAASVRPYKRLEDGLARLEQAQHLIAGAQLDAERALDRVDGAVYATLARQADALHQVGATLVAAHAALSYARLGAEATR
jgi:hypothetical protein